MKISHEIPKQLFELSKGFNDYPYVLGHLIKQDSQYRDFYKEELKRVNFSILDNSAFELGSSIPDEELLSAMIDLRPTHLILPDTVHDQKTTLSNSSWFWNNYRWRFAELGISPIGVVQGNSFSELYVCIDFYLRLGITYIAIPFDCIKDSDYSQVRFQFFKYLLDKIGRVGMDSFKLHFLGIQNPQELLLYSSGEKEMIDSIDTSSPILHGVLGNVFNEWGTLKKKPSFKLADNLDIEIGNLEMEKIRTNINFFKSYTR